MLTAAKPDLYYGARPEQLDRRVRDELSGHIIPSTQDDLPIAPNFFLAAKGPDGTAAVARRQACYDGALGARGMQSLQSYGEDEPVHTNNAYVITSIYSDGQLKMYTSHLTQPTSPKGRPEYCMTQLNTWGMTGNLDTFRQGATAYRNARDWTKEQRDEAIRRANERANDRQVGTLAVEASFGGVTTEASLDETSTIEAPSQESQTSLNEGSNITADLQESESSIDELASNYKVPAKRSSRHSKRSHQSQRKVTRECYEIFVGNSKLFFLPLIRWRVESRIWSWVLVNAVTGHFQKSQRSWHFCKSRPRWAQKQYHTENLFLWSLAIMEKQDRVKMNLKLKSVLAILVCSLKKKGIIASIRCFN